MDSGTPTRRELSRPLMAMLAASNKDVYLHPDDRVYGTLFTGGQRSGKTSAMLRCYLNDLRDERAAIIVMDPKSELVRRCLELTPPDCGKEVWYLNLGDPAFGMSPLRMYGDYGDFGTEASSIAESIVAALLAINEGQVYQSSRRYLYHAVIGALAIAKIHPRLQHALFEHVYALLLPNERGMREAAAQACQRLGLDQTGFFFANELPGELTVAASRTAERLDPPRNKISGIVGVPALRKFFQHPIDLPLRQIIDRRAVLLVDASLGTIGDENAEACLHFVFQMLHRQMQRQMNLPAQERPRVAVLCDEAHYLLSRNVIKQVATHRAAGLDLSAGIQYFSQLGAGAESSSITEEIRKGVSNLLQSRLLFRLGDPEDAQEATRIAMSVYATFLRGDPDSRAQERIPVEYILNLPNWYCLASWIVDGRRASSFIGRTFPMPEVSDTWARAHLARMREAIGPAPENFTHSLAVINDARVVLVRLGEQGAAVQPVHEEAPETTEPGHAANGNGNGHLGPESAREMFERAWHGEAEPAEEARSAEEVVEPVVDGPPGQAVDGETQEEQEARSAEETPAAATPAEVIDDPYRYRIRPDHVYERLMEDYVEHFRESPVREIVGNPSQTRLFEVAQSEEQRGPAPESIKTLALADRINQIRPWEEQKVGEGTRRLNPVDHAILSLLDRGGVVLQPLIARACLQGKTDRWVRVKLKRLHDHGLIARAEIGILGRSIEDGRIPPVYRLTGRGFRAAQAAGVIHPDRSWRAPEVGERGLHVPHDQHVLSWVIALAERLGPEVVTDNWRTPRLKHGILEPPPVGEGRNRRAMQPSDLTPPGRGHGIDGAGTIGAHDDLRAIQPDAMIELNVTGAPIRAFDLLLEINLAGKPSHNHSKLIAYDRFLLGWYERHRRYVQLQGRPVVVFVFRSREALQAHAETADRTLDGRIGVVGTPQQEWYFPGRQHIFFAIEEDLYYGSLRCFALPKLPSGMRAALQESPVTVLREVSLLPESMNLAAGRRRRTRVEEVG